MTKNHKLIENSPLQQRVVAIPENRQLDVLAALFERRQAQVLRIPLLSIADNPDQQAVMGWLDAFLGKPPDLFIIYTGEGLRRLLAAAERSGKRDDFVRQLAKVQKLIRGPKPARVLADLGLTADFTAAVATTEGVIETLKGQNLLQGQIAIQTYGGEPVPELQAFLDTYPGLTLDWVAPYVYGDQSSDDRVGQFIGELDQGQVDLLAFTSKAQVDRLQQVAQALGCSAQLQSGLGKTTIAAVGPVVAARLAELGHPPEIMPEQKFFMKPLVRAVERHFQSKP